MMRRALFVLSIYGVVLFSSLVSCGDKRNTPGTVRRTTRGDTLVVINTLPTDSLSPVFQLERDLIIGISEGEEPYMLTSITSIAADKSGNIYIGDWSEGEIRVFDSEGTFTYRFGRKGQGPGEFHSSWFSVFGIYPFNDFVAVEDIPRLIVFDRHGEYQRTFDFNMMQLSSELTGTLRWPICWFPHHQRILTSWTETLGPTGGEKLWFRMFTEDLQQVDVLGPMQPPQDYYPLPEGGGAFELPFAADLEWTITGESTLVYGISDQFRLYMYDFATGSWTESILEMDPKPVLQNELEAYKQMLLGPEDSPNQRPEWVRAVRRAPYPSMKPFFASLIGDDRGRIWAEEYVQFLPDQTIEIYRYNLFDHEGLWLGRVEVPERIVYVRANYLYTRGREEYPTVNRYWLIPN